MSVMGQNSEPFDFSKYQVKQESLAKNQTQLPQNAPVESQEPFDFGKYKVKEPPTLLQEFGRHTARTGARMVESIAGFPGDVVGFVKYLGEKLPKVPSFLESEPNIVQKAGQKVLSSLPNTQELKELSGYLTSGFTDPQSATEELGDEISGLATMLISPSKATSGFSSLLKNIGSSFAKASAVKGAGKGAELLGASPTGKATTEGGMLFLTGLLGKKTAEKFIGEQYGKARSEIPVGTMIQTGNLNQALTKAEQQLAKGLTTNTKAEVLKPLSELKAKASTGVMEVDELVQSFHDINERMNSKKLFDELTTSERKLLKNRYSIVQDAVRDEIAQYGAHNPKFYKTWKDANQGYATIQNSKNVSNFIESKAGKLPKHLAGSVALDLFLGHPLGTTSVLGTYAAVKSGELLARIAKSPILREHYMSVLIEASKENLPGMIKSLNELDKASKDIK